MKIRFVTGNDWMSRLIRIGERDGWATHTEAVMPDGKLLGAHYDGGVLVRPAGYDKGSTTRELVVDLPSSSGTDRVFYDFLKGQVGKPYNLKGIFGLEFGTDWRDKGSWFCSELMAAALEHSGRVHPLASINNHISPRDLLLALSAVVKVPQYALS